MPQPYTLKYQYSLGQDLLVAPVHEQGALRLDAVPAGRSLGEYLTGEAHHGGEITVDAPIGKPPVFYRAKSEWASLLLYGILPRARPQGNLRADGRK